MKELRYYQKEAHESLKASFSKGTNAVLWQMATGTGKTFTTTSFINENKEIKNVLWLTHKEELIDQSALSLMLSLVDSELENLIIKLFNRHNQSYVELMKRLESGDLFNSNSEEIKAINWIRNNMGLIKREINQYDQRIVVASVQTATRRIHELEKRNYSLVVIDEAHLALSKSWMRICRSVPHEKRLGLTATPERMDGVAMDQLFDEICYVYDIRKGIQDKYLCEIDARRIQTNISLDKVRTTAGELNNKDLKVVDCPERNNLIATKWLEYADRRKTLCFAVSINHAVNLAQTFKNRGIKAEVVVSDEEICPDRRAALKNFIQGDTEILVNVDILTTGFDYPNVGCILLARPTKSRNLYIQIVGRGTRLKDEEYVSKHGQKMLLMDVVDISNRHSLINSYSLDYGKRIEDRVFLTEEERVKLLEKREKQEAEAARYVDRVIDKDETINLLQLPEMNTKDLSSMERDEMSPKQAKIMKKLGYDIVNNHYTKADAFIAIGQQSASSSDLAELKSMGYDVTLGATRYQYVQAKADKLKKYQEQREKWKKAKKDYLKKNKA